MHTAVDRRIESQRFTICSTRSNTACILVVAIVGKRLERRNGQCEWLQTRQVLNESLWLLLMTIYNQGMLVVDVLFKSSHGCDRLQQCREDINLLRNLSRANDQDEERHHCDMDGRHHMWRRAHGAKLMRARARAQPVGVKPRFMNKA